MAANTGALRGMTMFVTGGSRGIGLAIALKAAKDGANIVLAAKTATPHPKLPGTIYTAAQEIVDAGGQCLPCVVDVRDEGQVAAAITSAVKQFGGIDILVNNASAINLTGTLETPMKKYDLMHQVNGRGTYLTSQLCLPHLLKSKNPHILNLSPPLNLNPVWFKSHVAYTMAKYNMSMCVLGMAEEFREAGVAVNALWPKTAISTAAMEMLGGGKETFNSCRKPSIMADSAYLILTKPSKSFTGQFVIDEDILKQHGVSDMEQYAEVPGAPLMPDFFLDLPETPLSIQSKHASAASAASTSTACENKVQAIFNRLQNVPNETLSKKVNAVFQFDITGKDAGQWFLDLKNGSGRVASGKASDADCTLTMSDDNFVKMLNGDLQPTKAFIMGKLKISGSMQLAMKLERLLPSITNRSKL